MRNICNPRYGLDNIEKYQQSINSNMFRRGGFTSGKNEGTEEERKFIKSFLSFK